MQNTTLDALAASIRVIGDELLTIADALKTDATAAPLAQDPQQAFTAPAPGMAAPGQLPTAAPGMAAPGQLPIAAPGMAAPGQQPPTTTRIGGMAAPPQTAAPAPGTDAFTAFSNTLIDLGRQAGPQGLVPIMPAMLQRYAAPPGNDLSAVPAASYGPFLEEVRAYIASLGGRR